ncbi:hypothetical protein NEOLI_003699 [Neolecta irregularis DAH-3]|uniref:Inosine/uridine-preferring nucleoside hydrolase domain-containing protein n=1 Tax=Neolecta irregularis (strain DAH-3) TaxID=1198029 RepID=A0A1U7LML1_NEOID|nr:hypothetical protein NEOLI_003699 [Neolecta irregularis DAH-3]|eukprot:OLL23868.1 hypothetical protein NEOLI_003699 [Neolecta irregularis DAH-3]
MAPLDQTPLWLDCDPGHDDALAIILAAHSPDIHLLGISTTHGNTSLSHTTENALRILTAINRDDIPVYAGAEKPIMRPPIYAPQIHGESGLDGTDLLPLSSSKVRTEKAINAMAEAILGCPPGETVLCATGPVTNVAHLISVYPEVADHLREVVIMGGAIGSGK